SRRPGLPAGARDRCENSRRTQRRRRPARRRASLGRGRGVLREGGRLLARFRGSAPEPRHRLPGERPAGARRRRVPPRTCGQGRPPPRKKRRRETARLPRTAQMKSVLSFFLLPVAFLLLLACGSPPPPAQPRSLLLITVDTLRADHVGAYGWTRARTPAL